MIQFFILVFMMVGFSCGNSSKNKKASTSISEEKSDTKKFFDYDEIDHYSSRYGDHDVLTIHENRSRSTIDSLKLGVVLDRIPKDVSDLAFIDKLEQIGYKKGSVDKTKFSEVDKIFIEKPVKQMLAYTCIYIYNDILIFKNQNKVIGTAKICFGCMGHEITGTNANTDNFGQDGDYEKLEKLLRK